MVDRKRNQEKEGESSGERGVPWFNIVGNFVTGTTVVVYWARVKL